MSQGTKICKHCQSEIPKKAKVCPQCRKKQGGKLKGVVIVLVVLMAIGAASGESDDTSNKTRDSEKETQSDVAKSKMEKAKEDNPEPTKEAKAKSKEQKEEKKEKKQKEKKSKAKKEKSKNKNPDAKETDNEVKNKPQPVQVEESTSLYCMDLYENYENYDGQYVTISAPISYADEDTVDIKGYIEGITGMINITLLEARDDLKEGDFITVTGRVDGKALGYLYIKDANISQTGDGPAQIYSQQKAEYDALSAQKAAQDVADFKASCETFDYEDVLRNPGGYKDRNCVVSGTVDQIIEGWFDSYTIFVMDGAGNKWGCVYSYKEGESHLLEGDSVTMYGKCAGTEATRTVLGQQVTLPRIDIDYVN